MNPRRPRRKRMSEINVVPYIDVMLVLLIIFMVTAPLLAQGVVIELPEADAEPVATPEQEPVVVDVDSAGRYYVNVGGDASVAVDGDELMQRIAAVLERDGQRPVLVRGDRDVAYGRVVGAMVLIQQAGAPSVGLMTQPAEAGRQQ